MVDGIAHQPGHIVQVEALHQVGAVGLGRFEAHLEQDGDFFGCLPSAISCSTSPWRGVRAAPGRCRLRGAKTARCEPAAGALAGSVRLR